jgi:hypothetical protein
MKPLGRSLFQRVLKTGCGLKSAAGRRVFARVLRVLSLGRALRGGHLGCRRVYSRRDS